MQQKKQLLLRILLSFSVIMALSFQVLKAQTPGLVADIASGTPSSSPGLFTTFNNKLYFVATQGTGVNGGTRWFSTNGTNAGTYGISTPTTSGNFAPGNNLASSIAAYTDNSNNTALYFIGATNGIANSQFYKMGTNEVVTLVKTINTSGNSCQATTPTVFNNKLYFAATDGTASGNWGKELWVTDGTTSGTSRVYDINQVVSGSATASSNPSNLTVLGNYLYFSATDGVNGIQLWQLGTSGNPSLVQKINGTSGLTNPGNFTIFNSKLYFTASSDGGTTSKVWVYDPIVAASSTNPSQLNTTTSSASGLVVVGSNLYFVGTVSGIVNLWKSDGTAANTAATSITTPTSLVNSNGTLFYANSTDFQVYTYNGTSATKLTTTLTAAPTLTTTSNNLVYFSGTDVTYTGQPWVSDGTSAGTYRIGVINPSSTASATAFYYFNGFVYFRATNGSTVTGSELYKFGYNTWTGTTSNNFSLASNWSAGFVPDYTTDVKIPLVSTMPSLTGTNTIRGLNVPSGVTLTNTGTLQVGGDLVNNGSIAGSGTLQMNGSAAQAINGLTTTAQSISGTGTITNLTLPTYNSVSGGSTAYTNGATITSGMQSLTGTLSVQAGMLTTGGFLTLKSTSIANSAVVDVVGSGSTTGISGNVTVERYIPKGFRGYRDMAPQVYNASYTTGNIYANWQSAGAMTSGSGIFITGPGAKQANTGNFYGAAYPNTVAQPSPNNTNGLDYSIGGLASIFSYNNTTGTFNWNYGGTGTTNTYTAGAVAYGITDTKATNLDAFTGYRVVVRGDRNFNLGTTPIVSTVPNSLNMYNATTIKATGSLVYGTITYSKTGVTGNGNGATPIFTSANYFNTSLTKFSMVANPYVCPVDWVKIYDENGSTTSGINASYWFLDPTTSSNGTYRAYNALSGSSGVYSYSGITAPIGYRYIQAGQAVFVQATSSDPKVVFTEAAKVASTPKTSVFGTTTLSKLYISLLKQATATTYDRIDGAAEAFRTDFGNTTYGPQDALKFNGTNDNLSITNKGKELSIDGRLPATSSDVIALAISKPSGNKYQLEVDAAAYVNNGFKPSIFDAYNKTTTALSTGITTIDFTVDTAVVASFSNRFSILFAPSALPVNSILASASLNNKVATITWNTVGEQHVARFEVEKSTDAKTFATIRQSIAKNTTTAVYSTTDNNVTATSYYRIKAVSTTGATSYSNVAKLTTNNSPLTTIYPNPLKGKTLNVSMDNLVAGKYTVSIINVLGVKVSEQTINHFGGSATHAITISNTLAAGTYSVTISEVGSKQLVHQSTLSVQP